MSMSNVWRCTLDDASRLTNLLIEINNTYHKEPLSLDKAELNVCKLIEAGFSFCSNRGIISGMLTEDLFRDQTALTAVTWFSDDRYGDKLLTEFIRAGEDAGVELIRIQTISTSNPAADKILEKRGFDIRERVHTLTL